MQIVVRRSSQALTWHKAARFPPSHTFWRKDKKLRYCTPTSRLCYCEQPAPFSAADAVKSAIPCPQRHPNPPPSLHAAGASESRFFFLPFFFKFDLGASSVDFGKPAFFLVDHAPPRSPRKAAAGPATPPALRKARSFALLRRHFGKRFPVDHGALPTPARSRQKAAAGRIHGRAGRRDFTRFRHRRRLRNSALTLSLSLTLTHSLSPSPSPPLALSLAPSLSRARGPTARAVRPAEHSLASLISGAAGGPVPASKPSQ